MYPLAGQIKGNLEKVFANLTLLLWEFWNSVQIYKFITLAIMCFLHRKKEETTLILITTAADDILDLYFTFSVKIKFGISFELSAWRRFT